MGLCATKTVAQATSEDLDKNAMKRAEVEARIRKLLLLGTGESGKSTIFRQMVKLYGKGFSEQDRVTRYRNPIVENVIEGTHKLIQAAKAEDIKLDPDNTLPSANYFEDRFDRLSKSPELRKELAEHIAKVWADPGIKEVFKKRARFQVFDSCSYFLDKVMDISNENFIPTDEDILRVRVRTTGMNQEEFDVKGLKMRIIDVGGQRNERRKWIHSFEGVTAVIYVSAISEYDQTCFEDELTNRMEESLKLFSETMNLSYFNNTATILFLNKMDLFEAKFTKADLQKYFPDFAGETAADAYDYFVGLFTQKLPPKKDIYPHVVTATDSQNIVRVFQDVRHIIVKDLLSAGEMPLM